MTTKLCPYCAEEIQEAAIVCKHCGRDLAPKEPKDWNYITTIFHYRYKESGWLSMANTSASQAKAHFWGEVASEMGLADVELTRIGWEVVPPRGPECIELGDVKNREGISFWSSLFQIIFSFGLMLIPIMFGWGGYHKWWMKSCTVTYKKPSEKDAPMQEIQNLWKNHKSGEWQRIEYDPATKKHYWWYRPDDFNPDDPKDDRWVKVRL
jgi:hypothetical protein